MYKAYKFRMYPCDKQKELITKTFGCVRFVYNHFLSECREIGHQKAYCMCKKLKDLEKDYPFLKEVYSCSLRNSIFNLEDSYRNFFSKRSSNHKLAKSILDASFNKICNLLKWKVVRCGKYYYQINTYYPSSKLCSCCDNKTEVTNDLSVRRWKCSKCGNENDRDINASINIMFEGLRLHYQN